MTEPTSPSEPTPLLISPQEYARVRQMFGCGVAEHEFAQAYWAMPNDDLNVRKRALGLIAQRAWVAHIVRHQLHRRVSLEHPYDEAIFNDFELPSLEVHHLFSCLDALKVFGTRQARRGVGTSLIKLFAELPQPLVSWLMAHVVIYVAAKDQSPVSEATLEEIAMTQGIGYALARQHQVEEEGDPSAFMRHLLDYFYDKRRNPYSHEGAVDNVPVTDITASTGSGRSFPLRIRPLQAVQTGEADYAVFIQYGMDEATLLRVILYAAVLQRLNIEVTAARVEQYVRGCSRQSAAYRFFDEVAENAESLGRWAEFDAGGGDAFSRHVMAAGIPSLGTEWAHTLESRLDQTYTDFERTTGQFILAYAEAASKLNSDIEAFNATHPPREEDPSTRGQAIAEFFTHHVNTGEHRQVIGMAQDRMVLRLVQRIAENPCYN